MAHAAVLADCQTFAGLQQLFLADRMFLARSQTLGCGLVRFRHRLVSFDIDLQLLFGMTAFGIMGMSERKQAQSSKQQGAGTNAGHRRSFKGKGKN